MNDNLKNFIFLLVGVLFGAIMDLSIKYPLEIKNLQETQLLCNGIAVTKLKINITGKITEIECADFRIIKLN